MSLIIVYVLLQSGVDLVYKKIQIVLNQIYKKTICSIF